MRTGARAGWAGSKRTPSIWNGCANFSWDKGSEYRACRPPDSIPTGHYYRGVEEKGRSGEVYPHCRASGERRGGGYIP
jgi:hypothetical protein